MISFKCQGESFALEAGQRWSAVGGDATYQDVPATEVEATIADIRRGMPWRTAVAQRYAQAHPWLHRIITDPSRDLFFREHPPARGARILDIGAGWGQMALPFARLGTADITALEPTPERLGFIEAAARQEGIADRIHFMQAGLFEVEFEARFDLACCIGVLEWVPKFRAGDPRELQVDFLRRARSALLPGGRLVVGIENRLGLKYLLGARDDHTGVAAISVFDTALASQKWKAHAGRDLRVFTPTRVELEEMLREAGFGATAFYGAFPDYKLPAAILPLGSSIDQFFSTGNHVPEHDGCDGTLLDNQAELKSHYGSLAQLGIASNFVPSFYVVAT